MNFQNRTLIKFILFSCFLLVGSVVISCFIVYVYATFDDDTENIEMVQCEEAVCPADLECGKQLQKCDTAVLSCDLLYTSCSQEYGIGYKENKELIHILNQILVEFNNYRKFNKLQNGRRMQ